MKEFIKCCILLANFFAVLLTCKAEVRKCYVCGHGANDAFAADEENWLKIIPNCDNFDNKSLDYIFECPGDYRSCLTEIEDGKYKRKCGETIPINDCQKANGVIYCYCNTDLCNDIPKIEVTTFKPLGLSSKSKKHLHITDDEDLLDDEEASGMDDVVDETSHFFEPNEIHTPRNGFTLRPVTTNTVLDRPNDQNSTDSTEKSVNRAKNLSSKNLLELLVILSSIFISFRRF